MSYYIAYGSNTPQEMEYRCVGSQYLGKAILKDYRLLFRQYATIEPSEGESIEVMLYKTTKRDEKRLDTYEGYPSFYKKKIVECLYDGSFIDALVYYIPEELGVPCSLISDNYLLRCLEGYNYAGIPVEQLLDALHYSARRQEEDLHGLVN